MSISLDSAVDIAIVAAVAIGAVVVVNKVMPSLISFGNAKIDEILESPRFVSAVHKAVASAPGATS